MKIETHLHTVESSPCAKISAADMVSLYQKAGYDTVIVTDHYNHWAHKQSGCTTTKEYTDYVLSGYHAACQAALGTTLRIFLGLEVSLLESPNDYLLYGITEDFLYKNPALYTLTLPELYKLCHSENILVVQAHPFRAYCNAANVDYLDGIEVYNGNPRHDSHNDKAKLWCQAAGLLATSGSDFHELEDLGKGGILMESSISTMKDFCDMLKMHSYTLLKP